MSAPQCVVCTRPTPDGYACMACGVDRPAAQLAEICDMTPAARAIAYGQSRNGTGGNGGKPGSRMELNLEATSRLDAVQQQLTERCRIIANQRGITPPWLAYHGDPITAAAQWLTTHLEWARHRDDAAKHLGVIAECARIVRGIARGPAAQRYLGECRAVIAAEIEPCPQGCGCRSGPRTALSAACAACFCLDACHAKVAADDEGLTCTGDVYGIRGASEARCRACGAKHETAKREAWLNAEVRSHAFPDRDIADALRISVKTIRSWATERPESRDHNGKLTRSASPARLQPHTHDRDGNPLYLLGDVADIAAADAARREERRAKRARKHADQPVA